jgi:hypothetical protein
MVRTKFSDATEALLDILGDLNYKRHMRLADARNEQFAGAEEVPKADALPEKSASLTTLVLEALCLLQRRYLRLHKHPAAYPHRLRARSHLRFQFVQYSERLLAPLLLRSLWQVKVVQSYHACQRMQRYAHLPVTTVEPR